MARAGFRWGTHPHNGNLLRELDNDNVLRNCGWRKQFDSSLPSCRVSGTVCSTPFPSPLAASLIETSEGKRSPEVGTGFSPFGRAKLVCVFLTPAPEPREFRGSFGSFGDSLLNPRTLLKLFRLICRISSLAEQRLSPAHWLPQSPRSMGPARCRFRPPALSDRLRIRHRTVQKTPCERAGAAENEYAHCRPSVISSVMETSAGFKSSRSSQRRDRRGENDPCFCVMRAIRTSRTQSSSDTPLSSASARNARSTSGGKFSATVMASLFSWNSPISSGTWAATTRSASN